MGLGQRLARGRSAGSPRSWPYAESSASSRRPVARSRATQPPPRSTRQGPGRRRRSRARRGRGEGHRAAPAAPAPAALPPSQAPPGPRRGRPARSGPGWPRWLSGSARWRDPERPALAQRVARRRVGHRPDPARTLTEPEVAVFGPCDLPFQGRRYPGDLALAARRGRPAPLQGIPLGLVGRGPGDPRAVGCPVPRAGRSQARSRWSRQQANGPPHGRPVRATPSDESRGPSAVIVSGE
jgi:hypothetical protein